MMFLEQCATLWGTISTNLAVALKLIGVPLCLEAGGLSGEGGDEQAVKFFLITDLSLILLQS